MKEKICGIYKIENLINCKVYIGQSNNIQQRWYEHKNLFKKKDRKEYNYPLYKAMRKYGIKNFSFEILEECEIEKLNMYERRYIFIYNSYTKFNKSNGYNQTIGG